MLFPSIKYSFRKDVLYAFVNANKNVYKQNFY